MTAPIRSLARLAAPGIIFFLGACSSRTPVAEVNGTVITKAELAAQVRVFQSVRPGMPDDEGTRRMVLEQLVNQALLVQAAKGVDMQAYLRAWLAQVKIPTAVRAAVDVDPISFF